MTSVRTHAKDKDNGKVKVSVKNPLYNRYNNCKLAEGGKDLKFCKKSIPTKKNSKDVRTIKKLIKYFFNMN